MQFMIVIISSQIRFSDKRIRLQISNTKIAGLSLHTEKQSGNFFVVTIYKKEVSYLQLIKISRATAAVTSRSSP